MSRGGCLTRYNQDLGAQLSAFEALRTNGLSKPTLDPIEFVTKLRQAHAGRTKGEQWPCTDNDTINNMRSLDENRRDHTVTSELLRASKALTVEKQNFSTVSDTQLLVDG